MEFNERDLLSCIILYAFVLQHKIKKRSFKCLNLAPFCWFLFDLTCFFTFVFISEYIHHIHPVLNNTWSLIGFRGERSIKGVKIGFNVYEVAYLAVYVLLCTNIVNIDWINRALKLA